MDCADPSTFNEKLARYQGKGFWFDYPTMNTVKSKWLVEFPEMLGSELSPTMEFQTLDEIRAVSLR